MKTVKRPIGVTILALLFFLGTVTMLLLGVLFAFGARIPGADAPLGFDMPPGLALVVYLILAGIGTLIALGFWKVRKWAWTVTIGVFALGLLLQLIGLVFWPPTVARFGVLIKLGIIAWYSWVIWYLLRPRVRKVFDVS